MSELSMSRAMPAVLPNVLPAAQPMPQHNAASAATPDLATPTACKVTRLLPAQSRGVDILAARGNATPRDYVNDQAAFEALHSQLQAALDSPLGLSPLSMAFVRYRDHMNALHDHHPQRYARVVAQLHPTNDLPAGIPAPDPLTAEPQRVA